MQIAWNDTIYDSDFARYDSLTKLWKPVTAAEMGVPQVDTTFEGAIAVFDTLTDTWVSSNRAAVLGYKEYVALLNQTGVSVPVATVIYNDIGSTVTWTYLGVGQYGTNEAFGTTRDKVVVFFTRGNGNAGEAQIYPFTTGGNVKLSLRQFDSTGAAVDVLQYASITVRVYN